MNYAVTSIWLFLAFAGWAIALGGLSALQRYVNGSGSNGGWAIPANYPLLRAGLYTIVVTAPRHTVV